MLGRLGHLVADVVACIGAPAGDGRARATAIAECAQVIELCLERQRSAVEREDRDATASDDLQRWLRMLAVVDRADVPFVLRQIRRVLGRLDV